MGGATSPSTYRPWKGAGNIVHEITGRSVGTVEGAGTSASWARRERNEPAGRLAARRTHDREEAFRRAGLAPRSNAPYSGRRREHLGDFSGARRRTGRRLERFSRGRAFDVRVRLRSQREEAARDTVLKTSARAGKVNRRAACPPSEVDPETRRRPAPGQDALRMDPNVKARWYARADHTRTKRTRKYARQAVLEASAMPPGGREGQRGAPPGGSSCAREGKAHHRLKDSRRRRGSPDLGEACQTRLDAARGRKRERRARPLENGQFAPKNAVVPQISATSNDSSRRIRSKDGSTRRSPRPSSRRFTRPRPITTARASWYERGQQWRPRSRS